MGTGRRFFRNQTLRSLAIEPLERRALLTTLPNGFAEFQVGTRLDAAPVSVQLAPDGRLFVTTDDNDDLGTITVVKNGQVLNRSAIELDIVSDGEQGMIGMVLDPNFENNQFIYVMYTSYEGGRHNRISRFQFSGDTINPNSERILLELDRLGNGTVHNGGGMAFGNDGKLYVGIGDNQESSNASDFGTLLGKILRINPDGSIPNDNPFPNLNGKYRAIYASGVRNPFTMDADPTTGRIFFNDVGPASFEEINEVKPGADYGWPSQGAGPGSDAGFEDPVYAYRHNGSPGGCAITGGRFNQTTNSQFPEEFTNKYYFTDYCGGWIYTYDLDTGDVEEFADDLSVRPVSPVIDQADGSLYYLSREQRSIFKIEFQSNNALQITQQPQGAQVAAGQTATFAVTPAGDGPFNYRWQKQPQGGSFSNISGATSRTLTVTGSARDDGARYRVIVSNDSETVTSNAAELKVTSGSPPQPVITLPGNSDSYVAGDTITYAGFATDPDETGNLPLANLTWEVTYQHDDHDHPVLGPTSGQSGGSFTVPTIGETSANTWFRIHLTAVDSTGLETKVIRDIFPEKSVFSLDANVSGIELTLDGTPTETPVDILGVVGVQRSIGAPSPQFVNGRQYEFVGWSDGGEIVHNIFTPDSDQIFTATFREVVGGDNGGGGGFGDVAGAVTHFAMNEGAGPTSLDLASQGVADTAVLSNGAAWASDGIEGSAIRFDGIDDFLSIPDSSDFNDRNVTTTTVGLWFRADNVDRAGKQLLFKQQSDNRGFNIYLDDGRLYVGGWSEKADWSGTFLSTDAVESGKWHHVALVIDAGDELTANGLRGYLDGTIFGSGDAATIKRHLGNVSLGFLDQSTRFHSGVSEFVADQGAPYAGLIDEVRVYHAALTAAQIRNLAGSSGGGDGGGDNGGGDDGGSDNGGGGGCSAPYTGGSEVSACDPVPTVDAVFTPTGTPGEFELNVTLENFTVRPESVDGPSSPNEGHLHLLIDGVKVERFFDLNRTITVPAGQHLVQVELSTNDHQAWTVNGVPIRDGQTLTGAGTGGGNTGGGNGGGGHNHDDHDHNAVIPGVVTHFTLDEGSGLTALDSSPIGVGDSATLSSGATWSPNGILGGAVRFDGVDDFLSIPDSADFNDRDINKTSVSLWFNADDIDRDGKQLLFKQSSSSRGINIYLDGGQLYVGGWSEKRDWSGTFLSTPAGQLQSGQWYHVVLVLDADGDLSANGLIGYLDGAEFGRGDAAEIKRHLGNVSLGLLDQSTRFHTGESQFATDRNAPFAGLIDDVRVFHRALPAADVQTLAGGNSATGQSAAASRLSPFASMAMDTSGDGYVTPLDALLVMNSISRQRAVSGESASQAASTDHLDVNHDGAVTALDALMVINYLSQDYFNSAESEASGSRATETPRQLVFPEPSPTKWSDSEVDEVFADMDRFAIYGS